MAEQVVGPTILFQSGFDTSGLTSGIRAMAKDAGKLLSPLRGAFKEAFSPLKEITNDLKAEASAARQATQSNKALATGLDSVGTSARKADKEVKALLKDLKDLGRQSLSPTQQARAAGIRAPGSDAPMVDAKGLVVQSTALKDLSKTSKRVSVDLGNMATQFRDMDGIGLRLGDTLDAASVIMSGKMGLAIGATVLGVGALVLGFNAAAGAVENYASKNDDVAARMGGLSKAIDDTEAGIGGWITETYAISEAMDAAGHIIDQQVVKTLRLATNSAKAGTAGDRLRDAIRGLGDGASSAASPFNVFSRAINNVADSFAAAANNAAMYRAQQRLLAQGGADFDARMGGLLAGDAEAGRQAALKRAGKLANKSRAGGQKFIGAGEARMLGVGNLGDLLGTDFAPANNPNPRRGGGGGGGSKDPLRTIRDIVKERLKELQVARELARLQESAPLREVNVELERAKGAYGAVADELRFYAMELSTASKPKVVKALKAELAVLEEQEKKLGANVKLLKERQAQLRADETNGFTAEGVAELQRVAADPEGLKSFAAQFKRDVDALGVAFGEMRAKNSKLFEEARLLDEMFTDLGNSIKTNLVGAFQQLAETSFQAFGAFAVGESSVKKLKDSMLDTVGDIATTFANLFIETGAGMIFLNPVAGAGLIAAGLLLHGGAGAAKAKGSANANTAGRGRSRTRNKDITRELAGPRDFETRNGRPQVLLIGNREFRGFLYEEMDEGKRRGRVRR